LSGGFYFASELTYIY